MALATPGERIRWALKQRGISAAAFARQLGLTRSAVSQWWSKCRPTLPHRRIERIAELLNVDADWLLTGRGSAPHANTNTASNEPSPANALDIVGVRLVGIAEGEVWREGAPTPEMITAADQYDCTIDQMLHDGKFTDLRPFAFEVRGRSANQTVYPGEYAICVDYRQVRPAGPQPADLVVVKKRRGVNEYKLFVARLRYRENTWELHYRIQQLAVAAEKSHPVVQGFDARQFRPMSYRDHRLHPWRVACQSAPTLRQRRSRGKPPRSNNLTTPAGRGSTLGSRQRTSNFAHRRRRAAMTGGSLGARARTAAADRGRSPPRRPGREQGPTPPITRRRRINGCRGDCAAAVRRSACGRAPRPGRPPA